MSTLISIPAQRIFYEVRCVMDGRLHEIGFEHEEEAVAFYEDIVSVAVSATIHRVTYNLLAIHPGSDREKVI